MDDAGLTIREARAAQLKRWGAGFPIRGLIQLVGTMFMLLMFGGYRLMKRDDLVKMTGHLETWEFFSEVTASGDSSPALRILLAEYGAPIAEQTGLERRWYPISGTHATIELPATARNMDCALHVRGNARCGPWRYPTLHPPGNSILCKGMMRIRFLAHPLLV